MDTSWSRYHDESNRIVRALEGSHSVILVAETLGRAVGEMLARIAMAHQPQTAMDTGQVFGLLVTRIQYHIATEQEFEAVGAGAKLGSIGDQILLAGTTLHDTERDRLEAAIRSARPSDCLVLIDALGKIIAYGATDADRELAQIKSLEAAADAYLTAVRNEAQH